jgi:hypothetical protein
MPEMQFERAGVGEHDTPLRTEAPGRAEAWTERVT